MLVRRVAALGFVALLLAACAAGPGAGGQLEGTDWVLRSYNESGTLTVVPPDQFADARFTADRIKGFSGCDDYSGLYQAGGRTLLVSQLASTRMACAEDAMAFEATFQQLLVDSRFYGTRQDTLTIYGADGSTLLVFDPAPRNPLLGSWVVDSFVDASGAEVTPLPDTALTAVFGLTHVGGSAGCNTYDGTYGTNGRVVAIGRLATTRLACPDEVMTKETDFLAALGGAAFVERRGTSLTLRDRSDAVIVAMSRPTPEPSPSATASPTATATATATASPSPTPTPTASPTPTRSPSPTPAPSATPTPTPTTPPTEAPTPSPAPTVAPPSPMPATAQCTIEASAGGTLATIVYPQDWFTISDPVNLACRYFDPAEITAPTDGSAVQAAVTISGVSAMSYADAVSAATDTALWDVASSTTWTVSGLPATLVEATSKDAATGVAVGTTRYAYLIDYSGLATVMIATQGMAGSEPYVTDAAVVDLIASSSTLAPAPAS